MGQEDTMSVLLRDAPLSLQLEAGLDFIPTSTPVNSAKLVLSSDNCIAIFLGPVFTKSPWQDGKGHSAVSYTISVLHLDPQKVSPLEAPIHNLFCSIFRRHKELCQASLAFTSLSPTATSLGSCPLGIMIIIMMI